MTLYKQSRIGTGASIAALSLAGFLLCAPMAMAKSPAVRFDIPAENTASALNDFARQAGIHILFPYEQAARFTTPKIKGQYSREAALGLILANTNLEVASQSETSISLRVKAPLAETTATKPLELIVTGSHIRGARQAAPSITQSQKEIEDAGLNTLAEAFERLPQNFGGGQNPGLGFSVPESRGVSLGAASTLNLRGLGSDATLTLLNGNRLAYDLNSNGIDISAIPLAAISRIEIVTDGASAAYGSDAVGGVANIKLRPDFHGLRTDARLGYSTAGGNYQQQYSLVGGQKGDNGGWMLAYDFARITEISADDRDYSRTRAPGLTLYPSQKHQAAILSGHYHLAPKLSFAGDILYNKRWNHREYALTSAGQYQQSGAGSNYMTEVFAILPRLNAELGGSWQGGLSVTYAEDRANYAIDNYSGGAITSRTRGCYCNKTSAVEVHADGTLATLPAGDAKLALGGGHRTIGFHAFRSLGTAQDVDVSIGNTFAYGELDLPLVSPLQGTPFVYRLQLNAALRHEQYAGADDVTTPKLGLIYAPGPEFDFTLTWGKSFKMATPYQLFNYQYASIYTAASRGGSGYPTGSIVISKSGGNPNLAPEKATSKTFGVQFHPDAFPGLRLGLTYFEIDYRDRVVTPITYSAQALSNPIYADRVYRAPTDAEKAAAVSEADLYANYTTSAYDPAKVVAIIDNSYANVAEQTVNGVDLSIAYAHDLAGGRLNLSASASYLESEQRLSALQPIVALSGTLFNPPHLRGRFGTGWETNRIMVSTYVNYIGGVTDNRKATAIDVKPMTTTDLAIRYRFGIGGAQPNTDLMLSVQNLFDKDPSLIASSGVYEEPYDSTNYSPMGRVVSLRIGRQW